MSKRPRKRHAQITEAGAQRSFAEIIVRPYVPIAFFALLTVIYFYRFIFTGDVIFGSDTGPELQKGKAPVAEKIALIAQPNWSRFLGGTPESAGLRAQYFPLHVIALFTSDHRYFGWRYVFAMFCAGYFTFLCVRGFGLHPLSGLIAGVAYMSAPAFLTFTYAGQFAKMSVIALFPLMYWALARGMHTRRPIYFFVLAGAVGIGIYTPHLQMVYFALWGIGFLFVYKLVVHYLSDRSTGAAIHRTLLFAGAICLGLAIGAEGVFPQYWNTKTATRRGASEGGGAGYDFAASWSLHPEEIFGLVIPEFGGFNVREYHYWGRNPFKLNSEYVGIMPLFFALFALGRIRKQSHIAFLFGLFVFAIAYSLGPHTPVHRLFYHLVPGVNVLRVPGMIAFLFSFALCALSAYGLHRLIAGEVAPETSKKLGLIGGISAAILLLFSFAPSALLSIWRSVFWTDMPAVKVEIAQFSLAHLGQGALLAGLFVGILTVLSHLRIHNKIRPHVFVMALLPLCLMDTWRIDKLFLRYENPNRVLPQERVNANAVAFLKQDRDLFRVLPLPDEDRRVPPLYGIDLVTGFNDFTIARYDRILKSDDLYRTPILNLLNTRYIVSPGPIDEAWLEKVAERDHLHIYRNPYAHPWFYLTPKYYILNDEDRMLEILRDPAFDPTETALLEDNPGFAPDVEAEASGTVELLDYDARQGRVELKTNAPGPRILVVSQNYHPHWRAFVNGEEKPLLRANYLWQGVAVEPGEHHVELRYRDPIVATTRWIALSGTAVLIIGLIASGRRRDEHAADAG